MPMSFVLQGHSFSGAEVVDLSLGGVGVWMDERFAALFEPNARLREVAFPACGLAPVPDIRLVFSTLPGQSARPGFMMFGGEFISPDPAFLASLTLLLALRPMAESK